MRQSIRQLIYEEVKKERQRGDKVKKRGLVRRRTVGEVKDSPIHVVKVIDRLQQQRAFADS